MKGWIVAALVTPAVLLAGTGYGAQLAGATRNAPTRYDLTVLPSLGGASSAGNSINDRNDVAGRSNLPGDARRHAILWRSGSLVDLGTLGGPNSSVPWPVKNEHGVISGISQTGKRDPLGEAWSCAAFFPTATGSGHQCVGFRWKDGVMRALPTLGGTNGFATGTNNRGETAGWAENRVRDPTCVPPQVLQFRAVVWGPNAQQPRQLPPLPGDTVSAATALNDRGQVVGISGFCDQALGRFSALHAVLWDRGHPIPLGTLGGVAWNTPMAINATGDVVGFANNSPAGAGDFHPHAFLWTPDRGIRDLGTLPGDVTSQALGVNDRLEVVGTSCDAAGICRAFCWRDGTMTNLNRLITSPDNRLTSANDINTAGAITGQARNNRTGHYVAFLAAPRR